MLDVKFYEVFSEEEAALSRHLSGDIRAEFTDKTVQESEDGGPTAKVVSIRTQSHIPAEWAPDISGILSRSMGYDHLEAYRREIDIDLPCGYLDNYCARAVAEHAFMVLFSLLRHIKPQIRQFESFHRSGLTGAELKGKNVLVIGVGNIGSQMVDIAKGLKMNVRGVDIDPKLKDLEYVSLEDGLVWADVILCALPLADDTEDMLGQPALKNIKKGAIFINISRGEISPVNGLKELLDKNILAGVGLDIFEDEKELSHFLRGTSQEKTSAVKTVLDLKGRDNVVFTPHNAFNTKEALDEKARLSAEAVAVFLKEGKFPTQVPA